MRFKPNGSSAQGEGGGAAGSHGQPAQPFVATHIWKSQDYDYPCAPTGRAWHDEASNRDFIEVLTDDGIARPIPKDELVAKPKRAKDRTREAHAGGQRAPQELDARDRG